MQGGSIYQFRTGGQLLPNSSTFINGIMMIAIIYLIYMICSDYIYYKNNKDKYIIDPCDFEDHLDKYNNSELYNKYDNLPEDDKQFLYDFINYSVLTHKKNKPKFNKTLSSIKENIILASIVSALGLMTASSGPLAPFKINLLQHVTSKVF